MIAVSARGRRMLLLFACACVLAVVGGWLVGTVLRDTFASGSESPSIAFPFLCAFTALLFVFSRVFPLKDLRMLRQLGKIIIQLRRWARKRTNVADVFEDRVGKQPNSPFLLYENLCWTFAEVDVMASRIAQWAINNGLACNDTVALVMENRPEYIVFWLAMSKLGVSVALVNTNLRGSLLRHSLAEAHAKMIIAGPELLDAVIDARSDVSSSDQSFAVYASAPVWVYAGVTEKALDHKHMRGAHSLDDELSAIQVPLTHETTRKLREPLRQRSVMFLIYTSGTTGLPKAAKFPHNRMLLAGVSFGVLHGITAQDRIYCALPLYHSAGGACVTAVSMYTGASIYIRRKFSASNFWKDCALNNCTAMQYVGELCRYLVHQPEGAYDRSHKVTKAMGNGLRPDVWTRFQERFGVPYIGELYGATEGNVAMVNNMGKTGAIGYIPRAMLWMSPVKIVRIDLVSGELVRGKDGHAIECEFGETGEAVGLILQNDVTRDFPGYTDSAASNKKVACDMFKKGDSWFRTGDLLCMDSEGFVFFKDRTGDTFRWRGENVATCEVAEVLGKASGLYEANVYGVSVPFCEGRCGMAALVLSVPLENFDFSALHSHLSTHLPSYARPLFLRIVEHGSLALTATFKHKKMDLVEQGFDIDRVKDPLYVSEGNTFVPLSRATYEAIVAGRVRL
eukprot:m.161897 g.161897  ORF g.161897 m.161897 type:complete len:680 (-) comp17078_c0_seq2:231-2270(-)